MMDELFRVGVIMATSVLMLSLFMLLLTGCFLIFGLIFYALGNSSSKEKEDEEDTNNTP